MPSVASHPNVIAARSHLPTARSHSEPDSKPATPFAMLLDSAAPADKPTAPQPADKTARPDRSDRTASSDQTADANAPAKADSNNKDAKQDPANATDGNDANGVDATDVKTAAHARLTKLLEPKPDADVDASAKAEPAEVPAPLPAQAAPALPAIHAALFAAPQAATEGGVPASESSPKPDALTGLQNGGKPVQADGQVDGKASPAQAQDSDKVDGQSKDNGKDTAASDAATSAAAQDTQAKQAKQAKQDKDAAAHAETDKAAGHVRLASDEPVTKPAADAALQVPSDPTAAAKASADAAQNSGLPPVQATATTAATGAVAAAAPAQPTVAVPLAGLAVEIASQAHAGKQRFEIRLDPPDLGRIDVRLDIDRDGHVTSRLTAERADTLDLLRRDSSQLERALQQAGLKTADNALEFSLRQQGFSRDDTGAQNQTAAQITVADDDPAPLEALRQGYGRLLGLGGGLDIRV